MLPVSVRSLRLAKVIQTSTSLLKINSPITNNIKPVLSTAFFGTARCQIISYRHSNIPGHFASPLFSRSFFDFSDMADNKFCIEYAARGTAGCKKCKEKIPKGEIRIAQVTANPFNDDPDAVLKNWHHVKCIFEKFSKARVTTKTIEDVEELTGWDTIKPEDRPEIMTLIDANAERFTQNRSKQKKTPVKKSPAAAKAKNPSPAAATSLPGPSASTFANVSPSADPTENAASGVLSDKDKYVTTTDKTHKDNSFRSFRVLVANVADTSGYLDKTELIRKYISKGHDGESFKGDVYLVMSLLLPGLFLVAKRNSITAGSSKYS